MNKQFDRSSIKDFADKRLLITGGAGYIATNLISLLKDVDCHIMRLDREGLTFPPISGTAQIEDIYADIRDRSIWEKALSKVDFVFHFAAQTSTYVANKDPVADVQSNTLPMLYLLEACRRNNCHPTVLFSSTVTVIGIPTHLPVDSSQRGQPVTVYDLHKLMAEEYLKYYVNQGVVRGAALRLSNVYGPGPKSSRPDRGILNLMIRKALAGETLTIYGTGQFLRDYIYVEDVVHAFLMAARHIEQLNGQHFVIGSGQGHTIAEAINIVAERVAMKTDRRVDVEHVEPEFAQSPIEARNFVANTQQFSDATGWKALYSLVEGIDLTIESYGDGLKYEDEG